VPFCNNGSRTAAAGGPQQFHRNRILVREWDIWYFIQNRMSVGAAFLWYDVSNIREASPGATPAATAANIQGANNVARNLGCNSSHQSTLKPFGRGCDWVDFSVTWRYSF
jgi:hypothetical protein